MEPMHSLMKRQLKQCFGDASSIPPQWQGFVNAVNDAYRQSDVDREMLERSLELSSQELLQANSEMRAIFQAIPDLMFRLDDQGTILAYEAGRPTEFLRPPHELLGKRIQDIPSAGVGRRFRQAIAQVHASQAVVSIEYSLRIQGQPHFYEARLLPLPDNQMIAMIRDITERKRAEEALQASEERFRSLIEQSADGIILVDSCGKIIEWNRSEESITGIPREQAIGADIGEIVYRLLAPERRPLVDIELLGKAMRDACRTGSSPQFGRPVEAEIRTATGERRFVTQISFPIKMGDGFRIGTISRDMTERKQAEQALCATEDRYRDLVEHSQELMCTHDLQGQILSANPAAVKMLGYPEHVLLQMSLRDLLAPEVRHRFKSYLAAIQKDGVAGGLMLVRNSRGERRIWEYHNTLRVEGLNAAIVRGMARDVTDRNQADEKIRRLHAELEQRVVERTTQLEAANRELEAFAYSVSHDLRAPLRAIDGYSRILMEDYAAALDAEGRHVCQVIQSETWRMGQLIENLLAFSRVGRAEMKTTPVNMENLADAVFAEIATPQDRERIEFRRQALPAALADPALIRQVWTNLLSNAVKFTAKEPRTIVEVSGQARNGEIVYAVKDNGVGFEMQYADKLFGVFQRLHSEKDFPGTGVGLAIVQRIIQRHGGRIWADAAPNNGATFYFTLSPSGNTGGTNVTSLAGGR